MARTKKTVEAEAENEVSVVAETTVEEQEFEKSQLLGSAKYAKRRDLLNSLLKDGEKYTFSQVDELVENFMKGKVK